MASRTPPLQCPPDLLQVGNRVPNRIGSGTSASHPQKKADQWKRVRACPAVSQQALLQVKRLDWEMLKVWAATGVMRLTYLDESGCCCHSPTDYSYARRGQQKRVHQHKRRGRRINIWGVWEQGKRFDYALMLGTLKTTTYLKLMDWQASLAEQHFKHTGQFTVIVLDNASVHRSHVVQLSQWQRWQQQGLLLFFLPPYQPQMNRIEDEWLHLKRHELACRVFEDEYDLSLAIMAGIEARARKGKYKVDRFKFN